MIRVRRRTPEETMRTLPVCVESIRVYLLGRWAIPATTSRPDPFTQGGFSTRRGTPATSRYGATISYRMHHRNRSNGLWIISIAGQSPAPDSSAGKACSPHSSACYNSGSGAGLILLRPLASSPGGDRATAVDTRAEVHMEREIVIAGAGVAGLTAAINLKRAGRAVRALERSPASGAQRFPDWDAVENWTSLEDLTRLLERIGVEGTRFRHAGQTDSSVIEPYGRRYDLRTPRPLLYLIKRGAVDGGLEHGLQAQAEAMGVPIEYSTPCPPGRGDIWAGGTFGQGSLVVSAGLTFHTRHPDWTGGIVDPRL